MRQRPRRSRERADIFPRRLHLGEHRAGVPGPSRRIALGRPLHNVVNQRRQARHDLRGSGHLSLHVLPSNLFGPITLERDPSGQHLEEHDACGVQVGPRVSLTVGDEFRGDVLRRGQELPVGVAGGTLRRPGEPEVGDLHDRVDEVTRPAWRRGHEDVLRLHVAVHETRPVGDGERREHLFQYGQGLGRVEAAPVAQDLTQRPAADELHDQVGRVLMRALVEDRDDVGMG